jgi:hypothetical protein
MCVIYQNVYATFNLQKKSLYLIEIHYGIEINFLFLSYTEIVQVN